MSAQTDLTPSDFVDRPLFHFDYRGSLGALATSSAFLTAHVPARGRPPPASHVSGVLVGGGGLAHGDAGALTPEGNLVLQLTAETAETLGLPVARRSGVGGAPDRYVANVALGSARLAAELRRRDRLRASLDRLGSVVHFRLVAIDTSHGAVGGGLCSPVIGLDDPAAGALEFVKTPVTRRRVRRAGLGDAIAAVAGLPWDSTWDAAAIYQVDAARAALAGAASGLSLGGEDAEADNEALLLRWGPGLVSGRHCAHALAVANAVVADGRAPWAVVAAWGDDDSPLGWGGGVAPGGDAGEHDADDFGVGLEAHAHVRRQQAAGENLQHQDGR